MTRKIKTYGILAFLICNGLASYSQSKTKVKSIENQYHADQGNGYFLNPILRGN